MEGSGTTSPAPARWPSAWRGLSAGLVRRLPSNPELLNDGLMTSVNPRRPPRSLRAAAVGGLAFTVLYVLNRILQGAGPDSSTAAAVADYSRVHRSTLLASEVAVGLALLAFIPFLAALVPVIWRAGQETLAVAVAISGGVFVAMGFVSNAAETALIGVADGDQPAAILVLNQLHGRIPIVWSITALVAALSLAVYRTGLVWRWLGRGGIGAAAVFLLGSIFSVLGGTPEGSSSPVGVAIFIVWMLALSVGLWRTVATSTPTYPWLGEERGSSVRRWTNLLGVDLAGRLQAVHLDRLLSTLQQSGPGRLSARPRRSGLRSRCPC